MRVGVVKEIKPFENRVGVTPAGCREFYRHGHSVFVERGAGIGSGFPDGDYESAGANMCASAAEVFRQAELIVKVKEPLPEEFDYIREHHIIFTFFHFASDRNLTDAMRNSGATCIAYETVEAPDGSLPLLIPMSEVAGRMSIQQGARWLEKPGDGRGVLLGGVPGVLPARVMILGGGVVGAEAARMASGLGADVTILDVDLARLRYLADIMPANVNTLMSTEHNIRSLLDSHDLIIGAVLIHGSRAPMLITRDMLQAMRPGSVIIDVDVDQGGCVETSRPTNHEEPVFTLDGILHYCVPNMPGAVPYTSTLALTNATLPAALQLAELGWRTAGRLDPYLQKGLNIISGEIVYEGVAAAFGYSSGDLQEHLNAK